ncbi:MAG: hypothetical protein AAGE86_11020 [Pseudomonadota bacterium]
MSQHSFRNSRHDRWSSPRLYSDPCLRALAYGKVRPMEEPTWLEKLFGRG